MKALQVVQGLEYAEQQENITWAQKHGEIEENVIRWYKLCKTLTEGRPNYFPFIYYGNYDLNILYGRIARTVNKK